MKQEHFRFKHLAIRFCYLWVLVVLNLPSATADSLVMKDNQTLSGQITAELPDSITIETPQGKFTLPRTRILRIVKDSHQQNQIKQLQAMVSQGNLDTAVQLYQNTDLNQQVSPESFNTILLNGLGPIAANITATSQTVSVLTSLLDSQSSSPAEILLLTASLSINYGLEEQATGLLSQIDTDSTSRLTWPASTINHLLSNIARRAMESGNGILLSQTSHLASLLPVARNATVSSLETFQAIKSDIRSKQYLAATIRFRPELFLHSPNIFIPLGQELLTAIQSETNRESNLAALESARSTVLPYMPPDIQERAMKHLITNLLATGNNERAQSIADTTSALDPDLGALLQHLIQFKNRYPNANKSGSLAMYNLATWAKDMGLNDEARSIFISLRSDPRFLETVNIQIEIIENAEASKVLKTMRDQFRKNQFAELQKSVHQFLQTNPPEAYEHEARGLLQLSDFQKWSASQTDARKAEVEFQNAERLAQRGEYDAATDQLNRIQIDRQDSQAAQKAHALRQKILKARQRDILTSQAGSIKWN